MKEAIYALKGHDDKIRCILNKADCVTSQQLMRVYGALMWSLGKTVKTPEVPRIYIGSFWDQQFLEKTCAELFEAEESDLIADLRSLPRFSMVRKINELVKRAKMVRIHALLISHLREKIGFFGKAKKQKKIQRNLKVEFEEVMDKYGLPRGDFPNVLQFRSALETVELSSFKKLTKKAIQRLEVALSESLQSKIKIFRKYWAVFRNISIRKKICKSSTKKKSSVVQTIPKKTENTFSSTKKRSTTETNCTNRKDG
ncbi:hypothetical protein MHBO_001067 [Bonamia ostreae]|uniref:DUF5600 domain-containing protein n=1 Tax=Bonamia ostreae TaxID=126728 RepID=A0ABV2AHP0_9EUKA